MWFPIEVRVRGRRPPPLPPVVPVPVPAPPPAPLLDQRPSTFIGLVSDLARDPKQTLTIVMAIGGILVILTVCFFGCCLGVATAAKGLNGIPLRYVWSVGVGSASLLTLITTLVTHKIKKWLRSLRDDVANDDMQGLNS